MDRIRVTDARAEMADAVNRVAYGRERIILRRRGRDVVAMVPIEDLRILEMIEDREDVEEARRRLADPEDLVLPYPAAPESSRTTRRRGARAKRAAGRRRTTRSK